MRLFFPALLALVVLLAAMPATADRADLRGAPPIRKAHEYRTGRHQVTPGFGFTVNDPWVRNFAVGLGYRYFFDNWIGIGFDFMGTYVASDTGLLEQVDQKLTAAAAPGVTARPTTTNLNLLATVGATLVPLYGKMMLFGKVPVAYDVHILVGAGYAGWSSSDEELIEPGGGFTPVVGIGTRWFVSEWIAAEVQVRDYMVVDMPLAASANVKNPPGEFEQNFMVTVGVSFFFPPELETEL